MNALNIIIPAAAISTARNAPKVSAGSQRVEEMAAGSATRRGIFFRSPSRRRRRFHDVVRPLFYFVVDAPQVFAEHADADELHSANEQEKRDECSETHLGDLDAEQ